MTALRFLEAEVRARRKVTPGMVRVTLGGEELGTMRLTGAADEYVRLVFPDPETGARILPEIDERGRWRWPEGRVPAHVACYTIRAARAGEIDLDFVVHGHGRASHWAQRAAPGDRIVLREPAPIFPEPEGMTGLCLLGDATALPAIGRMIEDFGGRVPLRAVIEVPGETHVQDFAPQPGLEIDWRHPCGNGIGPSVLPTLLREGVAAGCSHVWAACELTAARAIRRHLRHDLGWPAARYSVTAYWTDRAEDYNARWNRLDPAVRAEVEALWLSDRPREDAADAVEALLARYGL